MQAECTIAPFGPKYPKIEGLEKFRRQARVRPLTREEKHAYGDAVGEAIRKLQRTELMRVLTPTPTSDRPTIPKPKSPLSVPYSEPNPFPMVGDPPKSEAERDAGRWERPNLKAARLYAHAMGREP